VYALHDAVDMPAMLPDGSTSPRSVSSAISQRDTELGRDPSARVAEDLEAERRVQVPEPRVRIEAGDQGGETR
jgi:NADH-quinone oxidoreductase subunit J